MFSHAERRKIIMKFIRQALPASLLAAAALLIAVNALALPCNGRDANVGDTKEEVATKCGEAMFKERRTVKVEEIDNKGILSGAATTVEEWAFDNGPEDLMQFYSFENGKLTEIRSIGYGRQHDDTADTCRNGELLAVGDTSLDAYLKCGEPISKEKLTDKVIESLNGDKKIRTTIPIAEWTYRYGPDAPGYTLRIENGVATEIRTREFGK
jgi:hypothetical protein